MNIAPTEVAEIVGRFVRASNATFLARAADGTQVVYKPVAGERPLWDFTPGTLARREVLTFEVAEALGMSVVPPTALGDGPFGEGAIQVYVEADDEFDPVAAVEEASPLLWPLALLDVVCNNADRKAGHIFRGDDGTLYGIDHGLTFHPEDKLRTVLWGFSGAPFPAPLVERLEALEAALGADLGSRVAGLLGRAELDALHDRVRSLADAPVHPLPPMDRPAVPWPPV